MRTAWKIRVELKSVRPPIWRRLLVSDRTTLGHLHRLIQDAFGWEDRHLHEFEVAGVRYGDPANDEFGDRDVHDEQDVRLNKLSLHPGDRFGYVYDFGDNWQHAIFVEEIVPAESSGKVPMCLGGARACPPEDVGGIGGYARFLAAIADEAHPEHRSSLRWIGGSFDPERFEPADANRRLRGGVAARNADLWDFSTDPIGRPVESLLAAALRRAPVPPVHESTARALALRRDVGALLLYVRDHSVTGTRSRGNLPLKAVAAIAALFVEPPALELRIGSIVHRHRSEEEVPPVFFAHLLASAAGLVVGGPGRRLTVTADGESFLAAPGFAQVATLLAAWWERVNWLVLAPWSPVDESIAAGLPRLVSSLLRRMTPGVHETLQSLVGRMTAEGGWVWDHGEGEDMLRSMSLAIQRIVVYPLEDFGVLSTRRAEAPDLIGRRSALESFALTEFGQALLQGLG